MDSSHQILIPHKNFALRRTGPCGTTGRLRRGINQATIYRVDDISDPGAGRANLKPAQIYRAGEVPTCGIPRNCNEEDTVWGPFTFNEEDTATNPPSPLIQLAKSIAIDGTPLCAETPPGGQLQFNLLAGEINYDVGGSVAFIVGLLPLDPTEGIVIYSSSTSNTGGVWDDYFGHQDFGASFNNPAPFGTFYLKLVATPGTGVLAGLRNWTASIFNN